ncbi:MAG: hypothetical protein ACRCXC_03245 [Legionella sp.]
MNHQYPDKAVTLVIFLVTEFVGQPVCKEKQSDRTSKAGGLTVVSSPNGCRRLVQINFKNYLSHQHR